MAKDLGLQRGQVLAEKYKLAECIGRGGMGEVWRAEHLTLKADVAIKFIHTELSGAEDIAKRFTREAQAAAAIRSAHVVQILDYGVDGAMAYIVMELMQGESLADRLERDGRLAPAELAKIMTHMARAVGRAHEAGIVHRDLKPDNVFLTYADDELVAKVLDFGIAKFQPTAGSTLSASTRTGALMGTPYYMSPEQAEGNRELDFRTDIWAMGVIGYQVLIGCRPFDSDALGNLLMKICAHPVPVPSQAGPVPDGFDDWFATACNRDATARFASAKQAAEALSAICGGDSAIAGEPAPRPMMAPAPALVATNQPLSRTLDPIPKKSPLVPLMVLGVAGLLLVSGVGGYWYMTKDAPTAATSAQPEPEASTASATEGALTPTTEATTEPSMKPSGEDAGAASPEPKPEQTADKPAAPKPKAAPTPRPPRTTKPPRPTPKPAAPTPKPTGKPPPSIPTSGEGLL